MVSSEPRIAPLAFLVVAFVAMWMGLGLGLGNAALHRPYHLRVPDAGVPGDAGTDGGAP